MGEGEREEASAESEQGFYTGQATRRVGVTLSLTGA